MKKIVLFLLIFSIQSYAAEPDFSLNLQNADLANTIRLLANFINMNVIISPAVQGDVTMRIKGANHSQALDGLLLAYGLAKDQYGNVLYIAPQEELLKRAQSTAKWQLAVEQTAPLTTRFWQIHYAKAEDIGRLLRDERAPLLSKRGHLRVDSRTNIVWVQDIETRMQFITEFIKHLDIPVKQIVIAARLASVDSDYERELGINFTVKHTGEGVISGVRAHSVGSYSLAVAKLADGSLLDVKLSALENTGHAELISSPSLFTSNQQPALIEAGEEVPYQETSESGGTAVVFKKAVLGLKVTPQLLPGNKVLLQLQINQDRPSNHLVLGMPTISTRQITTSVLVRNGQTIVLGGIYETDEQFGEQRVPFLGRIPVLGKLFTEQNKRHSKRELLIFVTPTIKYDNWQQ